MSTLNIGGMSKSIEDIVDEIVPEYCNKNREYVKKMPVVIATAVLIKSSGWYSALETYDQKDKDNPDIWRHPTRLMFSSEPTMLDRPKVFFEVRNFGDIKTTDNLTLWIPFHQMQMIMNVLIEAEWLPKHNKEVNNEQERNNQNTY